MSSERCAEVLGARGPLARAVAGFEPRREQQLMAARVAAVLAARGLLAVEAGTGIGKTFAYLVPALLSGRQVVLSTGTRTLQEQLFHRDLPLVAAALGRPVRVALLKGRANYLCRHRLELSGQQGELPGFTRTGGRTLTRIRRWAGSTRTGDLAEVAGLRDDDPVREAVTSTRDNCLGGDCPEFGRCHLVAARREAQAADIAVVNHHLLLADLAMKEEGFGELLPGAEAVVLDEAHQVPEIAAQFFGDAFAGRQVAVLMRDAVAELQRAGLLTEPLRAQLAAPEAAVGTVLATVGGRGERIEWPDLPAGFHRSLQSLGTALADVAAALDAADPEHAGLRQCRRRALALGDKLQTLLDADPASGIRWVEVTRQSFLLSYRPFEVADRLGELMRGRGCAWIFTSATLAINGDFSHFLGRIGAPEADTLAIGSPFDFERQALLYLPQDLPDPASPGYTEAVLATVLPLVEAAGGRAFLLFTSHRALREAAAALESRPGFAGRYPLLVQGREPREALLASFRELGNAVLLGSASFWEGVDVRGDALALVVIDRLPFAAPDDPLLKARLEGIRRRGGNPFAEFQLPQAVLALKQGFGRLIRDPDDRGVVVICDPRLQTRGYGRSFLAALPPARRTTRATEAVEFLRRTALPVARPAVAAP